MIWLFVAGWEVPLMNGDMVQEDGREVIMVVAGNNWFCDIVE